MTMRLSGLDADAHVIEFAFELRSLALQVS
jgi:hypothetical protein